MTNGTPQTGEEKSLIEAITKLATELHDFSRGDGAKNIKDLNKTLKDGGDGHGATGTWRTRLNDSLTNYGEKLGNAMSPKNLALAAGAAMLSGVIQSGIHSNEMTVAHSVGMRNPGQGAAMEAKAGGTGFGWSVARLSEGMPIIGGYARSTLDLAREAEGWNEKAALTAATQGSFEGMKGSVRSYGIENLNRKYALDQSMTPEEAQYQQNKLAEYMGPRAQARDIARARITTAQHIGSMETGYANAKKNFGSVDKFFAAMGGEKTFKERLNKLKEFQKTLNSEAILNQENTLNAQADQMGRLSAQQYIQQTFGRREPVGVESWTQLASAPAFGGVPRRDLEMDKMLLNGPSVAGGLFEQVGRIMWGHELNTQKWWK